MDGVIERLRLLESKIQLHKSNSTAVKKHVKKLSKKELSQSNGSASVHLTYGDNLLFEATKQIFDPALAPYVEDIAHSLQQEHKPIHEMSSREKKQLIIEFIGPEFMSQLTPARLYCLYELNEPCLEAFHALGKMQMLPPKNAKIFYSTATAASGGKNAWHRVFDILGVTDNYDITGSSTINKNTGKTGVSKVQPFHTNVVEYDQTAKPEKWPEVVSSLVKQFCDITEDKFDYMFHWGCISQNKQPSNSMKGQMVSSWSMHEHWNLLMGIAMMQHACLKLNHGGTLVLKVRIFDNAQTLGLVALLSLAFEKTEVYENARQTGHFAIAYMTGFKGSDNDTVTNICEQLQQAHSYQASDILLPDFLMGNPTQFQEFKTQLQHNEETRAEIQYKHARCHTAIALCLAYLYNRNFDKDKLIKQLQQKPLKYSQRISKAIADKVGELNELLRIHTHLRNSFDQTLSSAVWNENL